MNKFIHVSWFVEYLFDETGTVHKATKIFKGMLKVRSPRLSDIAREMRGNESVNYKHVQCFLKEVDPRENLLRLFQN